MKQPLQAGKETGSRSVAANRKLIVGTRGSPLALAQTNSVIAALCEKFPETMFETKIITTAGDEQARKSRGKDSFTGTIDQALRDGEIDFAVHSLKDVPTEQFDLEIASFPKREAPRDALISRDSRTKLFDLPNGATIGTSSVRRAIQLRAARQDLKIIEISGNVQTRILKLKRPDSPLHAIVLAEAGLKRLGISAEATEILPTRIMLPAPGQGCLAITVRKGDETTKKLAAQIDDHDTRIVATCERSFSKALGGGCDLPVAALARIAIKDGRKIISLEGLVRSSGSTQSIVRGRIDGGISEAEKIGRTLAAKLVGFA